MRRLPAAILLTALPFSLWSVQPPDAGPDRGWIERSNAYTNRLLDVELQHDPERGSREGVAKFDELISNPTLADEMTERHELEAALAQIDAARGRESDKRVHEDLDILHKAFNLHFRQQDYRLQHEVPFLNASEQVFQGLRGLLDDQVAPERRPAPLFPDSDRSGKWRSPEIPNAGPHSTSPPSSGRARTASGGN